LKLKEGKKGVLKNGTSREHGPLQEGVKRGRPRKIQMGFLYYFWKVISEGLWVVASGASLEKS